MTTADIKIAGC